MSKTIIIGVIPEWLPGGAISGIPLFKGKAILKTFFRNSALNQGTPDNYSDSATLHLHNFRGDARSGEWLKSYQPPNYL